MLSPPQGQKRSVVVYFCSKIFTLLGSCVRTELTYRHFPAAKKDELDES